MPRYFTKEEAEALLEQVRPLMEEVQRRKLLFDELQEQVSAAEARLKGDGHLSEAGKLADKRETLREVGRTMGSLVAKVQELGVEVKDLEMGLIDFRARRGDEEIYLCWRVGEPGICWWHPIEGGFKGRQPL